MVAPRRQSCRLQGALGSPLISTDSLLCAGYRDLDRLPRFVLNSVRFYLGVLEKSPPAGCRGSSRGTNSCLTEDAEPVLINWLGNQRPGKLELLQKELATGHLIITLPFARTDIL